MFIFTEWAVLVRTLLLLFSFSVFRCSDHYSIISLAMSGTCFWFVCLLTILYPIESIDPSCMGKVNTNTIVRDEPRLVNIVPNGKRYVVGQGYDQINIVHVYGGTPYDMGFAYGKLMSQDLKKEIPEFYDYIYKMAEIIIKIVPPVSVKYLYCCL
jgi:hypothetical protein